jgi:hypothetical protein
MGSHFPFCRIISGTGGVAFDEDVAYFRARIAVHTATTLGAADCLEKNELLHHSFKKL